MFHTHLYDELVKLSRKVVHMRDQNRPEKVKEIYYAIKKDHPEISKEEAARIAIKQGKPGKQKQGPPYSEALSKESALHMPLAPGTIMNTTMKWVHKTPGQVPNNIKILIKGMK